MKRLRPNVPTYHIVTEPHNEAPDAGVSFEHLYKGLPSQISSVARHQWKENLLFFAKVEGGVLLPEI